MERIEKRYDVIVVGAGPGGMTAALYASRANLETLILDGGLPGGELNNTATIENYTGFEDIQGPELAQRMYKGSLQFGAEHKFENVEKIVDKGNYKEVHTSKKIYETIAVIIGTGSENKKLNVNGESELTGKGVSYCAVCDGAFFRNREIVVVGGGDSAVEEGTFLTQFADKVTIIHRRDELRAAKLLQQRALENDKVEFIWDSVVEEIEGEDQVENLKIRNVKTGEITDYPVEGVFVYIGDVPNTEKFADLGILNEQGWIETNSQMETSVPGIYAVGDVRNTSLRQVATAVGDGSLAGHNSFDYVEDVKANMKVKEKQI